MKCALARTVGAALLLTATLAVGARAQGPGVRQGNIFIPASSIQKPEDIGKRVHTNIRIRLSPPKGPGIHPAGGNGPAGGLSPDQIRQAYLLPNKGGSQVICIVDAMDLPTALADFNTFSKQFNLPQETSTDPTLSTNKVFQVVYAGGTQPPSDPQGWNVEEALDIEWSHAMAPSAKIVLVEATSATFADMYLAEDVAAKFTDGNVSVKEVSNSWSAGEYAGEESDDVHFQVPGVSFFASTGDYGAPAGYPATSSYVVGAGGTGIITDSNGNFVSEYGWSGAGGGPSAYVAMPPYQSVISSIVNGARGAPDIAAIADPNTGVSVYDGDVGGWFVVGGTSVACPVLAGIANLAGTAQGLFPDTTSLLTSIYGNLGTANFRDILTGNNGYNAGPGWDFVTGVGTPQGLGGLQTLFISSATPSTAVAGSPGFTITVNGLGFNKNTTVDWNGGALPTTYVSPTQLTAIIDETDIIDPGTYRLTADNGGGNASQPFKFVVTPAPLAILSLSPTSATAGGPSFSLAVNGQSFQSGAVVTWNGSTRKSVYISSHLLLIPISAADIASAGTAAVQVTNPDSTTSNVLIFTINAAPVITGVSPNSAGVGVAQVPIAVTGTGFTPGSTVNFNSKPLSTTYSSTTGISAVIPGSLITQAGQASITVSNPGGATSNSATFTILAAPPSISALSPSSVFAGTSGFTLTVKGTGFGASSSVTWNGSGLATTYVSSTTLTAVIPASLVASAGTVSVQVINTSGESTVKSNIVIFTINQTPVTPTITAVTPNSVKAGGAGFTLSVTGTGFTNSSSVAWNGGALPTTYVSATQVTAAVPAQNITNVGTANITVSNPGTLNSNGLTINIIPSSGSLQITSLNPSTVIAGGAAFTITVYGSGFTNRSAVNWNGGPLTTNYVSATQLTAQVPQAYIALPGSATFTVTNSDGTSSNGVKFTVTGPPVITNLSPPSAPAGSPSFILTVNGYGFIPGSTVTWNNTALNTSFLSQNQVTAVVPPADLALIGTANVVVVNPGSSPSNGATFTITNPTGPPTIIQLSPNTIAAGSAAFTLTVTGAALVNGSVVQWGSTALVSTFVNASTVTAAVPASLLNKTGVVQISILNPDKTVTNSLPFTVTSTPPTITNLSPSSVIAGSPTFTLTVTGTGFNGMSYVYWNGAPLPTKYVNFTTLTAVVDASYVLTTKRVQITVTNNPGNLISNPMTFFVLPAGTVNP